MAGPVEGQRSLSSVTFQGLFECPRRVDALVLGLLKKPVRNRGSSGALCPGLDGDEHVPVLVRVAPGHRRRQPPASWSPRWLMRGSRTGTPQSGRLSRQAPPRSRPRTPRRDPVRTGRHIADRPSQRGAAKKRAIPHDPRRDCVSTWSDRGVTPTQAAEWAGHGREVLFRVHARCVSGGSSVFPGGTGDRAVLVLGSGRCSTYVPHRGPKSGRSGAVMRRERTSP